MIKLCLSQEEEFRTRPRLDIIQPLPEGCEEISSDALTVRNFQENQCRDYRLGMMKTEWMNNWSTSYSNVQGYKSQFNQFILICVVIPEHSEGESLFYIISPKDIVVAKERDQDDHIDWLLEKKKYEACVQQSKEAFITFKNLSCTLMISDLIWMFVTGSTDGCRDQLQKH